MDAITFLGRRYQERAKASQAGSQEADEVLAGYAVLRHIIASPDSPAIQLLIEELTYPYRNHPDYQKEWAQ